MMVWLALAFAVLPTARAAAQGPGAPNTSPVSGVLSVTARSSDGSVSRPSLAASVPIVLAAAATTAPGQSLEISKFVVWQGHLEPSVVAPGTTAQLVLTATPNEGWHVYAYADVEPDGEGPKPTLVVVTEGFPTRRAVTDSAVHEKKSTEGHVETYHQGVVTWTVDLQVPADALPGKHRVAGFVGYQTCFAKGCDQPRGAEFSTEIEVAESTVDGSVDLFWQTVSYSLASKSASAFHQGVAPPERRDTSASSSGKTSPGRATKKRSLASARAAQISQDDSAESTTNYSFVGALGIAFLAGLILNVMPCVLPVIGLKIMAFVQQAGESRARVFALNVWFTAGLMSIFMVLATLVYFVQFGWGEQLQSTPFNVTLAAIVFAFGLSLLGVWEIPIPGFVGSGKGAELADHEGATGAFFKGVLTTILATPCTGPLLIPATAWAVKQPVYVNYAVFAMIGLGMASPYLLIGAFPGLVRTLPKPGAWMETFKQIMGFVLMATVVWIFSFLGAGTLFPALSLMLAVAVACWWIGRTPAFGSLRERLTAWIGGLGLIAAVGLIAFDTNRLILPIVAVVVALGISWLLISRMPLTAGRFRRVATWAGSVLMIVLALAVAGASFTSAELPWETFSPAVLDEHLADGNTVLIDFTADW